MEKMLELLGIDVARSFEVMPQQMRAAARACILCDVFPSCDYDIENNYFCVCANREFFRKLPRVGQTQENRAGESPARRDFNQELGG